MVKAKEFKNEEVSEARFSIHNILNLGEDNE
jgi:hypothetical protein